jgi:transcriptional regulator with XRE-family HTH domain
MMAYSTQQIASELKAARIARGLSQRALSELAAVPQSHISKIESGGVDLRISSLAEIARALDLEVMLVPRTKLSAVRSITRRGNSGAAERRPAYSLDEDSHG